MGPLLCPDRKSEGGCADDGDGSCCYCGIDLGAPAAPPAVDTRETYPALNRAREAEIAAAASLGLDKAWTRDGLLGVIEALRGHFREVSGFSYALPILDRAWNDAASKTAGGFPIRGEDVVRAEARRAEEMAEIHRSPAARREREALARSASAVDAETGHVRIGAAQDAARLAREAIAHATAVSDPRGLFRVAPGDIDAPADWSPVGWDFIATGGTGALLGRLRLGGPTTTGATREEVFAFRDLVFASARLLAASEIALVQLKNDRNAESCPAVVAVRSAIEAAKAGAAS